MRLHPTLTPNCTQSLVLTSEEYNYVSVTVCSTGTLVPYDVDGDGHVSFEDAKVLLG